MSATNILPSRKQLRRQSERQRSQLVPGMPGLPVPELERYYDALFRAYGAQDWWPGRTRFEVIVGAILTQNTSWTNVERAVRALRRERLLSPAALERAPLSRLAGLIRSSGYFRQKARKLKEFVKYLRIRHQGSLDKMFRTGTNQLREQLLNIHGIGPETADSILLYAGKHPVFVVDAYTRRILQRHSLANGKETYEQIQALFEQSLPKDAALYNEYHALIVHTGKHFCRKRKPDCEYCALRDYLAQSARDKSGAENTSATASVVPI
jgi:endonuclease III related protein